MDQKEKVKKLQQFLIEQGYGKVEVNGELDEATREAMESQQKSDLWKPHWHENSIRLVKNSKTGKFELKINYKE